MAFAADVLTDLRPEALPVIGPKVRDGDILLCAAKDPFSRLIGWSTKSPWSHVAIAYRWPAVDRLLVFECVQRIGVHAVSIERFISQTSSGTRPYPGKIVLARHADAPGVRALKPLVDYAVDCMGDPFSPAEVVKIAARITIGRLNRHMPKPLKAKDEFICSEYVANCFERVGIKIEWDGLGFIAPADFALDPKVRAVAQFQTR
jgi:hypothetical protein